MSDNNLLSGIYLKPTALAGLKNIYAKALSGSISWGAAYEHVFNNAPPSYSGAARFWFQGAQSVNTGEISGPFFSPTTYSGYFVRTFYSTASQSGYNIQPGKFRSATDGIAAGVIGRIIQNGGNLPTLQSIVDQDAIPGTEALGLPPQLWAATLVSEYTLNDPGFEPPFGSSNHLLGQTSFLDDVETWLINSAAVVRTVIGGPAAYLQQEIARLTGTPIASSSITDGDGNRITTYRSGEEVIWYKDGGFAVIAGPYDNEKSVFGDDPLAYPDNAFCFVAGTMVDMADGTQKPIEQINIGDQVMAFDPFLDDGRGGLRASRVTQTHATPNRVVIDFHGTRVTPGHLFLCGDGPDEGDYAMLLDIIRADGAVVRADGSRVRAATNCALGSDGDRMLTVGYFIDSEDAHARQGEVRIARIRAGTRLLSDDGKDWSFLDALAEQGFEFFEDGLVAQAGEEPHPFYYFGAPPQSEDYILKKSGFTLDQLLAADEAMDEMDGIPVPPAARQPVDVPQTATMQAGASSLGQQQPQGNRQERRRQKAVQRKKYGETLH